MSDGGNQRCIHLNTSYRYNGEATTEIPITYVRDHASVIIVGCPNGSTRVFERDEVQRIDPETDPLDGGEP